MVRRVLVVQPIHPCGIAFLQQEAQVIQATDPSVKTICRQIRGIQGVIVRTEPFTREIIECANALRVIARHGVGVDNIDVAAATEHEILVLNTPGANAGSVAEHAVGFMLALGKRTIPNDEAVRRGHFAIREEFATSDLAGKTLGIVGAGRTGSALAKKCQAAFNMRVLGYDPHLSPRRLRRIGVRRCNTLEELLSRADYVSIHAPLTEETRNLIGERELRAMKPRAFLINMARGGIVDEPALARALRSGWIAGAATDVFSTEPPPADNPLLSADRIILSPHLAALTGESAVRMAMQAAEGVLDVLKGRTPRYVVNRELLAK